MQDFKKLKVWEKFHQLTLSIYQVTLNFPDNEKYGLVSQLRRASASIPANIAAGCGRNSNARSKSKRNQKNAQQLYPKTKN